MSQQPYQKLKKFSLEMNINILKSFNSGLFIVISLLIVSIPNFEAPKNILSIALILGWLLKAYNSRDWGGSWNLFDTIVATWIITNLIVGLNAYFFIKQPIGGIADIFRYVLIGWVFSRIKFDESQIKILVFLVLISLLGPMLNLLGPKLGFFVCKAGISCYELNSVGHINHSGVYMLFSLTVVILYSINKWDNISLLTKSIFIICSIILAIIEIKTHSRAVLFGLATFGIYVFLKLYIRSNIFLTLLILLSLILSYSPALHKFKSTHVFERYTNELSIFDDDSARKKINNFSIELFRQQPIFGIGMDNFPNFTLDDIRQSVIDRKGNEFWELNQDTYRPYAHPHNSFISYLVGGGIALFLVFAFFWFKTIHSVYKLAINKISNSDNWLIESVAFLIFYHLTIGMVNTVFANENAIFTMIFIGILINRLRFLESKKI